MNSRNTEETIVPILRPKWLEMHGQAYLPSSIHLKAPQIPPDYKHVSQKITIKQTFIHLPI